MLGVKMVLCQQFFNTSFPQLSSLLLPTEKFGKFVFFFPGTLKFIQCLACGNSHGYRPFSKIP